MHCPALSEIAQVASAYYRENGQPVKKAIRNAVKEFNHLCNLDRQVGPLRIINDCEATYGITKTTTLRTALAKILGTHGGKVAASRQKESVA